MFNCSGGSNRTLTLKTNKLAKDGEISKPDFDELKSYVLQHSNESEELKLLSTDKLLYDRIKSDVKENTIIYSPIVKPKAQVDNVNFFIETSMSMGGYMNGGTNFQDVGNYLITALRSMEKKGSSVSFVHFKPNTIAASINLYEDADIYAHDLTDGRFHFGGSSPLEEVFKIIIDSSGTNDVNVFITDGIMSGTDNQINSNPQFNLEQRAFLSSRIQTVFSQSRNSGWGLVVYAFTSEFKPDKLRRLAYFTYNNSKSYNTFSQRPFYIYVFGKKELVEQAKSKIENNNHINKQIKEKSYFGLNTNSITKFSLYKTHLESNVKRRCRIKGNGVICKETPSEEKPVEFAIGLDLSKLPEYMQDDNYLNHHKVKLNNNLAKVEWKFKKVDDNFINSLNKTREKPKALSCGCTHYIEVKLSGVYANKATLNFKVSNEPDKWYEEWSTNDDSDIATNSTTQQKTFNLKYLMEGFADAYSEGNDYTIDLKIKIINNN